MSERLEHLQELASLRKSDPRRKELEREISSMTQEERSKWMNVVKETDLLYEGLPQIEVPAGLEAKLLQLPRLQNSSAPIGRIGFLHPPRLRLYAACLLILLPVVGYMIWTQSAKTENGNGTAEYSFLAQPVANDVAGFAVQTHEAPPPLAITSSDAAAVKSTLDADIKPYAMPFPAMIPEPKTPLALQGGGVCTFGPTHAIFTRWTSGPTTYTLYQFDGKALSIPQTFAKTIVHAGDHYRVSIWPGYGNPCTWALVMENKSAVEAFD